MGKLPKNTKQPKDVVEELQDAQDVGAEEVQPVDTVEEVKEEVEAPAEAAQEPVAPKQDKYAKAKSLSTDEGFDISRDILKNSSLSLDEKIEAISNNSSVVFKEIVEEFKSYDEAFNMDLVANEPRKFAAKVGRLYYIIRKALKEEDIYLSNTQLQIICLLFKKYENTSLHMVSYSMCCDEFAGTPEEYQDFQYIMATLSIILNYNKDRVYNMVNFKRSDFISGPRLEEFYNDVILG